jgi:hypothetical protein
VFDEEIINGNMFYPARDAGADTVEFKIRLPWYRSLPLSCVERVEVLIDGAPIPRDATSLTLYGETHPLDETLLMHDVSWFVLDTANVQLEMSAPPSPGEHVVDVSIGLRIPYTMDRSFTQIAHCRKTLNFVGRDW